MKSSLKWVLSDLITWDNTSTSDLPQTWLFCNCFLFPKTVTTRNQSITLIVLLWKLTIIKHTQVNCFYVLPHLQTLMTEVKLIFVFLKIVVDLLKNPQDDQLWTLLKIHFKFSKIFITHFFSPERKENLTLMSAKYTSALEKDKTSCAKNICRFTLQWTLFEKRRLLLQC